MQAIIAMFGGWKTLLGVLVLAAFQFAENHGWKIPDDFKTLAMLVLGVGVTHKLAKMQAVPPPP